MLRFAEALAATVILVVFYWRWSQLIRRTTMLWPSILVWALGSSVVFGLATLMLYYLRMPRFSLSLVAVALITGAASGAFGALIRWMARQP